MLISGDRGTGKTYLVGTAAQIPEFRDVLVVDAEGDRITLAGWEHIYITRATSWQDLIDVRDFMDEGNHGYHTVIIDSMTAMQDYCLQKIMEETKNTTGAPSQQEYNKSTGRIRPLIRHLRNRAAQDGWALILTAGIRTDKDEHTGRTSTLPAMTPTLAREIAGMVDTVAQLEFEDKTGKRTLYLREKPRTVVKTRQPFYAEQVPKSIEDPTMEKLFKLISLNKNETN